MSHPSGPASDLTAHPEQYFFFSRFSPSEQLFPNSLRAFARCSIIRNKPGRDVQIILQDSLVPLRRHPPHPHGGEHSSSLSCPAGKLSSHPTYGQLRWREAAWRFPGRIMLMAPGSPAIITPLRGLSPQRQVCVCWFSWGSGHPTPMSLRILVWDEGRGDRDRVRRGLDERRSLRPPILIIKITILNPPTLPPSHGIGQLPLYPLCVNFVTGVQMCRLSLPLGLRSFILRSLTLLRST